MRKYSLLVLCLAGITASYAQHAFVVKAKINNPQHYTLFLGYSANGKFIADTTYTVEDGWCVFKGSVSEPVVASFGVRNNPALAIQMARGTEKGFIPGPLLNFVLTNEEIRITGEANTIYSATVAGGKANKEWSQIRKEQNALKDEIWNLNKKYYEAVNNRDTVAARTIRETMTRLSRTDLDVQKSFIRKNPGSLVSAYFLSGMVNLMSYEELKLAYENLGAEAKSNSYATRIAKKIEGMNATAIGKEAVPINKKDINGNPVNLQTLKGKYVLIDFWGSWCGPCRMSHPHLKEVYSRYKDQGFEIVGVAQENNPALEENRKAWKEAIVKDDINWIQVLNNEDVEKFDAVKAYGVSAFPTKILLDREGKIIDRYVGFGGDELDKKLKALFGN